MATVAQPKPKSDDYIPIPELQKHKLICRIWNEDGTRTIAKPVVIPYGQPTFTKKIGKKDRLFKVNYYDEGMIKVIDGKMYYDTTFDNAVGGLSFKEYPEDAESSEIYTIFNNNAVKMYVQKGGIPLIYLMVAMGMAMCAFIAIIVVIPDGLHAKDQVKDLDNQITALRANNAGLQQEINRLTGLLSNGQ